MMILIFFLCQLVKCSFICLLFYVQRVCWQTLERSGEKECNSQKMWAYVHHNAFKNKTSNLYHL